MTTTRARTRDAKAPAKPAPKTAPREDPKVNLPAKVEKVSLFSTDLDTVPEFMRKDAGAGTENIRNEDIEIPRLKLIQGLSPEIETYNTMRPGNFFHTAHEKIFNEPFRVVPIYTDKRYILWRPRDDGGGILARADDGVHWNPANRSFKVKLDKKDGGHEVTWKTANTVAESGLSDFGTYNPHDPDSQPAATEMFNFLLAFIDYPDLMPAVFTFQRALIPRGRRMNTRLRTAKAPIYGLVFEFSSFMDTNKKGEKFYSINTSLLGKLNETPYYFEVQAMHEQFASKGLNIKDVEGMQDDSSTGQGFSPSGDDPEGAPAY